jgi:hypothetical protein
MKKKREKTKKSTRSKARSSRSRARMHRARRSDVGIDRENATSGLVQDLSERSEVSPVDTGGDVDADWQRAQSSGEETVGAASRPPISLSWTSSRARWGWRGRRMPRSSHRTKS